MKKSLLFALAVLILGTSSVGAVNSFELFWPLVAGKTKADSYYQLKVFKENIRGSLIFGPLQKADYSIFLATKRSLEIEKLLNENNLSVAKQTAMMAQESLNKASLNIDKYKQTNGTDTKSIGPQMVLRLDNITALFTWLSSQSPQNKELLQSILEQVVTLKARL